MDNRKNICDKIAEDMKQDATDFDGQPFTGKTMGTYMGYHGAAIASLAELVKSLLEEIEFLRQKPEPIMPDQFNSPNQIEEI